MSRTPADGNGERLLIRIVSGRIVQAGRVRGKIGKLIAVNTLWNLSVRPIPTRSD
jgi:hypothetical protein